MRYERAITFTVKSIIFVAILLALLPTFILGATVALLVGGFLMGYQNLRAGMLALLKWLI